MKKIDTINQIELDIFEDVTPLQRHSHKSVP
jgi:hypothetical protein